MNEEVFIYDKRTLEIARPLLVEDLGPELCLAQQTRITWSQPSDNGPVHADIARNQPSFGVDGLLVTLPQGNLERVRRSLDADPMGSNVRVETVIVKMRASNKERRAFALVWHEGLEENDAEPREEQVQEREKFYDDLITDVCTYLPFVTDQKSIEEVRCALIQQKEAVASWATPNISQRIQHFATLPTRLRKPYLDANTARTTRYPLVVVPAEFIKKPGSRTLLDRNKDGQDRFAVVSYGKYSCVAVMVEDKVGSIETLPNTGCCRIDENLRQALNLPSEEPAIRFYGARIGVRGLSDKPRGYLRSQVRKYLGEPRTLYVKVEKMQYPDMEHDICVATPETISLLGVEPGDHIEIQAWPRVFKEGAEKRPIKIKRRVYTGSGQETMRVECPDGETAYPNPGCLHLDLDGRIELGLAPEHRSAADLKEHSWANIRGYPVAISASVVDLAGQKLLVMFLAFMFLTVAIYPALNGLFKVITWLGLSDWPELRVALASTLAALFSLLMTLFVIAAEVRRRVKV